MRRFLIAFHSGRADSVTMAATICRRLQAAGIEPLVLRADRPALLAAAPELETVGEYAM